MAEAEAILTDARRVTLEALCETFVPAVQTDSGDPVEAEFMARGASALQVAAQIEALLAQAMMAEEIEAVGRLLDELAAERFDEAPLEARTAIVHAFGEQDAAAKLGLRQLKGLTFLFFYARYCSFGCQHGCKRSAVKTWLQDASDAGARVLIACHADRVLAEGGRARGVEATVTHADGSTTAVSIEAPTVIVAGGSVESPALLLRSGIGGPAVGKNLRLHPAHIVVGIYDERIDGWEGQIQSALSDRFFDIEDDCGFLIEAVGVAPGT
jgi:choline dehydrogenase-like flavoprotein